MNKRTLFIFVLIFIPVLLGILVSTRWLLAKHAVSKEWADDLAAAQPLAVTTQLEIIPLYESVSSKPDLLSGHGVSYLVRTDSGSVLLDVGNNPDGLKVAPFAQNMQALGISWDEVSRVVISHNHPDHVGGIKAFRDRTVSFGELPGGLGGRLLFVPHVSTYKGAVHATVPTLPAPDVATTGVISYLEPWPFLLVEPKGGEQALVVHLDGQGLVLITGCGHPGLERLVTRAESLYGEPVVGVVGGLHFTNASEAELQPQIQFLRSRPIRMIALSPHDSGPEARASFERAFPGKYRTLSVGESINFSGTDNY